MHPPSVSCGSAQTHPFTASIAPAVTHQHALQADMRCTYLMPAGYVHVLMIVVIMHCSIMTCGLLVVDASLERVQSLIAKAALLKVDQQRLIQAQQACVHRDKSAVSALQAALQAEPFSIDVFRMRLLDARRLGLNPEAHSAQGTARCMVQCQMLAKAPLQHDWYTSGFTSCLPLQHST